MSLFYSEITNGPVELPYQFYVSLAERQRCCSVAQEADCGCSQLLRRFRQTDGGGGVELSDLLWQSLRCLSASFAALLLLTFAAALAPQAAQAQTPAPTITLTATAGDGQVTLSWTFTNDDGEDFDHWAYRQKKGTGNYSIWRRITGNTNVRAHTVTGLENDSAYTFEVARGETVVLITSQVDPASNEVTVTPMAPSVTVSKSELTVSEPNSGTYTVVLDTQPAGNVTVTPASNDMGAVTVSDALTFTRTNWDMAQSVTVKAVGDPDMNNESVMVTHTVSGYGSLRTASSVTVTVNDNAINAATPALAATPGNRQVRLKWKYTDISHPTLLYNSWVYRQKEGAGAWSDWKDISGGKGIRNYTVTGLTNGAAYTFQVGRKGINFITSAEVILGPESNEAAATPAPPKPAKPRGLKAIAGNTQVVLSWTDPNDDSITGYQVQQRDGRRWGEWNSISGSDADTVAHTVTNLQNGSEYRFRIRAINDGGNSAQSAAVTATPANVTPPTLTATAGVRGAVTLNWTVVDDAPGRLVANAVRLSVWQSRYRLKGNTNWATILHTQTNGASRTTSTNMSDIIPHGGIVEIQIQASGSAAGSSVSTTHGPWSNTATITLNDVDDNNTALKFTGAPVTVAPGEDSTYTIALTKPYAEGAVSIGSSAVSKATVSPASLTFTRSNYSVGQTVTVSGLEAGTVTINHAFRVTGASADAVPNAGTVAVMVTGNDPEDLTLSVSELTVVEEGSSGTYTVKLGTKPSSSVTVAVGGTSLGEVSASPTKLTFTTGNWNAAQTVTVSAGGDDDATDDTATLVNSAGSEYGSVSKNVAVTVTDNDEEGLTLSKTELTVDEEGSGVPYTVQLATKPAASVTVTVGGTSLGEVSASPTKLTFTTGNWNAAQTVAVTAGGDVDTADDTATLVNSAGSEYGSVSKNVAVTVDDNDTEGLTLSKSELTVAEEGSSVTYTVQLATKPAASVTVTVGGDSLGEVSASPTSLTFTTGNWSTAQTVTVSAGDDADAANDSATLVNSAGSEYGSVSKNVAVTVTDNDEESLTLSKSELTVDEEGSGVTYTVQLATKPSASVTVTVSGVSGEVSASPTSLTFTTGNWSTAQTVTVSAGGDDDATDDTATLVNSAGSEYGSVSKNVAVKVDDDDNDGLTLSVSELTVNEDSSGTYAVKLNTLPTGSVTVSVGGDSLGEVSASPTSLTFTTGNWNAAQTVTVSAGGDDDANDDTATLVNSAGSEYGSVSKNVAVTVKDNDKEGLTLSKMELTVTEDGSGTYAVKLNTLPTGSVTVSVGGDSLGEVSASPTSLTFTTGNWNAAQTVTVSAGGDDDANDDTATLVNSAGSEYGSVSKNVAVTVKDNDKEGLTLSKMELTVTEDGSGVTYTVQLATKPAASVTVTVGGTSLGEVSASPTKLTFTTGNWNAAQTVTVSAGGDDDANDEMVMLSNSAGSEYGSVSKNVAVTVTDNDEEGLTLSVSELTVNEDSARTYTVKLDTLPSSSVTVTVSGASGEVSVSPTSLTFTTVNWNAEQTVTVTAGGDVNTVDDTATLSNSAGSEYSSVSKDLTVTVDDDDNDGLTLSASELTVTEGGSGTYTVKLDTLPSGNVTVTVSGASGEVSAAPASLTFSTANWSAAQTVTVTAGGDDDAADDTATLVNSAGNEYGSVSEELAVTVDDDDTEGLTLSVSGLTIAEGGTGTYTVKLATLPAGSVTVTPASDATAVATVSGPLTFSTGNWSEAQTVTVTTEQDDDSADGTAGVSHAVTGYGSVMTGGMVSVTVSDNDQLSTGLRKEHEGGVHELHVQFGQSMVGVANDIIVSRTSGTVSARQNSMLIAGRQILFGSPHPSAAPLPRAYTDQPLRLDGDVELTRQRVDSVVDLLSDSSFNVSSATGGSPGEGGLTLWGQGGKRSFKRNGAGRSLDGSVTVGGIGFEIPSEGWMGGLAYFRTRGKGNVTATSNGESVKSEERVTMNSVHPYVHWRASEQVELWGTLGYGTGRADSQLQQDDDSTEHRKGRMELLSALMGTRVSWDFDLAFKGEVAASRTTTKGLAAAPMRSNQQQYKAVVEWSRRQNLSAGGQLLPKVEAGVRYDDDSYSTGLSMVVAGSVRYTDADGRWSLEAGGSVLRSRTSKRYREKGVYVGVELRSEAGDTGPSMSIQATQGEMAEALQAAWTESAIDGSRSEREKSDGVGTQLEFGYGLALGSGHMKPKVSVLLPAAGSKVYETGFEYWRGDRVSLELTHTHQPDTDRGDSIRLGGSLRW